MNFIINSCAHDEQALGKDGRGTNGITFELPNGGKLANIGKDQLFQLSPRLESIRIDPKSSQYHFLVGMTTQTKPNAIPLFRSVIPFPRM